MLCPHRDLLLDDTVFVMPTALLFVFRQQLVRSKSLRVAGQRALAELKAEFEALTCELVAEGQLSGGAAAHAASAAVQQQQRPLPGAHATPARSCHRSTPSAAIGQWGIPYCQHCAFYAAGPPRAGSAAAVMLASPDGARLTALLERWVVQTLRGMAASEHPVLDMFSDQYEKWSDFPILQFLKLPHLLPRRFTDDSVLSRLEQCLDKVAANK